MMRPYWIKIRRPKEPTALGLGVGITARSELDARDIFEQVVGRGSYVVVSVEPIDDMAALDQNHVVPNMGNIFIRGVWYPQGYRLPRENS